VRKSLLSLETSYNWREVSRLVLNPKSRNIKIETYSSLVLDILFDVKKDDYLTLEKIVENISLKFNLKGLSPLIAEDALKTLLINKYVNLVKGKYALNDSYRNVMQEEKKNIYINHEAMLDSLGKEVENIFGFKLDKYQKIYIKTIFESSLYEIFQNIGDNIINLIEEKNDQVNTVYLQQIIDKNSSNMDERMIENADKLKKSIPEAIKTIFHNPSDDFSKGILTCSNKHVMLRILGIDPELKKFRAELFKNTNIMLDTNIIIASLCEGSSRHKYTNWVLENTKSIGINLMISNYTLKEFEDAVKNADYLYNKSKGSQITIRILENEITNTYYSNKDKYVDWTAYISRMKQGAQIFIAQWNASVINSSDYDIDPEKIEELKDIIRRLNSENMKDKLERIIEHDAINILLIQAIREQVGKAPFNSPWFVTHHGQLRIADDIMRHQYKFDQVSCISCDTWFELIYPFIWAEVNQLDAAKAFTNLIATTVLPINTSSVKTFVEYVSTELQLPVEDTSIIKNIIEESHLRRTLENSLELGDMSVSLNIFSEIIGDKVSLEKILKSKENVIKILNKKITSMEKQDIKVNRFNISTFNDHIVKIENAKTNDEKKDTLENFADYFVSLFDDWKVVNKNLRTEAEEIDIMIQNNVLGVKWGDPILVECKNWSKPIGKDEIVLFLDKLMIQKCLVGILISKNGITGTETSDAGLRVREALWGKGIRIIVLTLNDLKNVTNTDTLKKVMTDRYYDPSKYLR